jgi:hypothetical protein
VRRIGAYLDGEHYYEKLWILGLLSNVNDRQRRTFSGPTQVLKDERRLRRGLLKLQEVLGALEAFSALASRRLKARYDTSDKHWKPWVISFIEGSKGMTERLKAEKTP